MTELRTSKFQITPKSEWKRIQRFWNLYNLTQIIPNALHALAPSGFGILGFSNQTASKFRTRCKPDGIHLFEYLASSEFEHSLNRYIIKLVCLFNLFFFNLFFLLQRHDKAIEAVFTVFFHLDIACRYGTRVARQLELVVHLAQLVQGVLFEADPTCQLRLIFSRAL